MGGGIGGLCLAQGLMKHSIDFLVIEQDPLENSRRQGYRLRIDADGDSALQACLPDQLYQLFLATTNPPGLPPIGAFDPQLNLIYRMPDPLPGSRPHVAADRQLLRQILMTDLGNRFRAGETVTRAEQDDRGVRLELATGETVEGDLAVAADGRDSALRRSILPSAVVHDLGMTCIYGKIPLSASAKDELPIELQRGFVPILAEHRITLGMGIFRSQTPVDEAWSRYAPNAVRPRVDPYLMWILVFPSERFRSGTLLEHAMDLTVGWSETLRSLLSQADLGSLAETRMCTSAPVEPWPSSLVTFLGDSIHSMTPAGGIGANTAMRDANNLCSTLARVRHGTVPLQEGLAEYENLMREYGFEAVAKSLTGARALYRVTAELEYACR